MKFISQIQISENNQGFYLTEFQLDSNLYKNDSKLIDQFLKSDKYTYYCLPDMIKKDKNNPDFYLRQLFDSNKISTTDFQRLDFNGLIEYFTNFSKHHNWGDDQEDFLKVLEDFKTKVSYNKSIDFFLISQDSYNSKSDLIRTPESWIYNYYFLIIWIDRLEQKLLFCEWSYD